MKDYSKKVKITYFDENGVKSFVIVFLDLELISALIKFYLDNGYRIVSMEYFRWYNG